MPLYPAIRTSGKVNLLDAWFEEVLSLANPLSPQRVYRKEQVQSARDGLISFFGHDFFNYQFGIDKAISDIHIANRLLLSKTRRECVLAVFQLVDLLRFATQECPEFFNRLKNERLPSDEFQATLYEVFIARAFKRKGIQYRTDYTYEDGTPLDGFTELGQTPFIVECKKLFSLHPEEFDFGRRAADSILIELNKAAVSGGFGVRIRIPCPIPKGALVAVKDLFTEAIARYVQQGCRFDDPWSAESKTVRIAVLPIGTLDEGPSRDTNEIYISLEVNITEDDPHSAPHAPVELVVHGGNKRTAITEKIRRTIRKAREQHELKTGLRLVVFIDSEELPDFRPGIFQGSDMIDDPRVRETIQRNIGDAIVVITRRSYEGGKLATKPYFFHNPTDAQIVDTLRQIFEPSKRHKLQLAKPSLEEIFRIGLLSKSVG